MAELEAAQESYRKVWQIASCAYPVVDLRIMAGPAPLLGLRLCMQNWDFWPPEATYASSGLERPLSKAEVPASRDPGRHIAQDGQGRAWPCSPGFLQYHKTYHEDSWQLIRGTEGGRITQIVEQACNMVDRRGTGEPIV